MKKILSALSLMFVFGISSAFTNDEKISSVVLESFKNEFSTAHNVSWEQGIGYYKAAFIYNGQNLSAYFSMDGELLSMDRNISLLQLPISLFIDLKNNHSDYWVTDLFEVNNSEGTHYYITLENTDKVVRLSANNGKSWKTINTKRKS